MGFKDKIRIWISEICLGIFFLIAMGFVQLYAADNPLEGEKPGDAWDGVVKAVLTNVTETYTAVGTVKPRSEMQIESQVGAQVEKVYVQGRGQRTKRGSACNP